MPCPHDDDDPREVWYREGAVLVSCLVCRRVHASWDVAAYGPTWATEVPG